MLRITSVFRFSKGNSNRPKLVLALVLATACCQLWMSDPLAAQSSGHSAQTIDISPANSVIAPSEKIQFTATVTNARDTAVRWSASAGTISATGMFQPPTGLRAPSTIVVTASRVADRSAQARTMVTINAASKTPVSNPGGSGSVTCGPPDYRCSRRDLKVAPLPSTVPDVGELVGANTIITDPDFGNRIARVTDAHTNPEGNLRNVSYVATASGSADDNLWNIDSTMFIVQDTGSGTYPFSFNPTTMQATRLYHSHFPATHGMRLADSGDWSRVNANILYAFDGTAIHQYDFTDRTNPPSPQLVYDFTSSGKCLPAGFNETWLAKGGVSGDDSAFGVAYSDRGGQGTGVYVTVYKAGSGCSMLNTRTGQVQGDWGANGTIGVPDRWTIHNAKLSKDGSWMVIAATRCVSSTCSNGPYFWEVGTTKIISCGDGGSCSGHWTEGYTHWENNDNSPISNQIMRAFGEAGSVSDLVSLFPIGLAAPFDQHQSWNNVDPADSLPFFSTTCTTTRHFTAPWYNEIIAIASNGSGTTWRFAHSYITARSQNFSTANGIGTVSQDGRFFLFSSDWMGKLGSTDGTESCRVGRDCRGDVFVVELR